MTIDPKLANTPAPAAPNAPFDLRSFLWKVLDRYDIYIGSTISRASTSTALNTLLVGYVILKAGDILAAFGGHTKLRWIAFGALGIAGIAAFVSTFLSFLAVAPYLGRAGTSKQSLVFFDHVANYKQDDFISRISVLSDREATNDIGVQVHEVATGLSGKFKWLRPSSWTTLVALAAVFVLGVCVMISTYIDWVQ